MSCFRDNFCCSDESEYKDNVNHNLFEINQQLPQTQMQDQVQNHTGKTIFESIGNVNIYFNNRSVTGNMYRYNILNDLLCDLIDKKRCNDKCGPDHEKGCNKDSKHETEHFYKEICCPQPKHFHEHKNCCEPKKIILECGSNPQDAIFEIDDDQVKEHQSFDLDSVIIDTSCLCKPQVKIEFSSIVFFEAEAKNGNEREIEVNLLFELVKICNGHEECVQKWSYIKEFEIEADFELEISEPFTVTFCDRQCPDCCKYKMKVSGKEFEGEFEALRVVKPDISALAQGICND